MKATKDARIEIRVEKDRKAEMEADANSEGFESTSAFVLWLYAQWKKRKDKRS